MFTGYSPDLNNVGHIPYFIKSKALSCTIMFHITKRTQYCPLNREKQSRDRGVFQHTRFSTLGISFRELWDTSDLLHCLSRKGNCVQLATAFVATSHNWALLPVLSNRQLWSLFQKHFLYQCKMDATLLFSFFSAYKVTLTFLLNQSVIF